jgi:cation diffusion facilitator CzcD-associated flavoprotein CzcO
VAPTVVHVSGSEAKEARVGAAPRVLVIGTGFAGIGVAARLRQDGVRDLVVLERGDDVGGTWRDNTYPGAACDIPSHLYSFSFQPEPGWTRRYAPQPEIQAYLEHCVRVHGLEPHLRLGRFVTRLEFDEATATWTATTADGERYSADVVVSAIGALRDPVHPALPGRERFRGVQMHTARWDHDADLAGRRVAVVGTGASAVQVAPRLAGVARHLTVFQRTPAWIVPRNDRRHTRLERALFRWLPWTQKLYRGYLYTRLEGRFVFFATSVRLNRLAQQRAKLHLRAQVSDRRLRRRLTPDYRMGCKRVLVSDDFYPVFERPDVALETADIEEVTTTGIRTSDGHVELDAIVWATGFSVDEALHPIEVTGLGGAELHSRWQDRPSAHLGITVPDFPNLYFLQGPNTGLGHNSIVYMLEAQIDYVRDAVRRLRRPGVAYLDVRHDVHDGFVREMDERHADLVWNSGCRSWYVDRQGRNFTLWPGLARSYRRRTAALDPDDYRVVAEDELPAARPPAVATARSRGSRT